MCIRDRNSTSVEDEHEDAGFEPLSALRDADWSEDDSDDVDYDKFAAVGTSANASASAGEMEGVEALTPEVMMRDRMVLHRAVDRKDAAMVDHIMASPAWEMLAAAKDGWGCTALHAAVFQRDLTIFERLLGACDAATKCQGSPLPHVIVAVGALPENHAFAAAALGLVAKLDEGPELLADAVDEYGRTALRLACELSSSQAIIHLLLDAVDTLVDARATDAEAISALPTDDATVGMSVHDRIRALLIGRQDTVTKLSALHAAAAAPSTFATDALTELVARCSAPQVLELRDHMARTALHVAATRGGGDAYEILVAAGADANAVDAMGRTPASLLSLSTQPPPAGTTDAATKRRRGPTFIYAHEACFDHHTCPPQASTKPYLRTGREGGEDVPPENVNRLRVLLDEGTGTLRSTRLASSGVTFAEAPMAEMGDVLRVHEWPYVAEFQRKCDKLDGEELDSLDGDTTLSRRTFEAALRAAGSACAAIDAVMSGKAENAFCAVRPPGHHAGPSGLVPDCASHGFCFLNNVAIAAGYALTRHRDAIKRVAIVDFDVHHGNGTEAVSYTHLTLPTTSRV